METANPLLSKEEIRKLLDAEKLKYCYECGICTASCSMAELLGNEYNPRNILEKIFLTPEEILNSEELWLCAWCYRCYRQCPQALKLPEIFLSVRKTAANRTQLFEKALKKFVKNVPLPFVTLFVCLHPERAGIYLDEAQMMARKLYKEQFKKRRKKKTEFSAEKIAIIGSGPAGLAAAQTLAKKGYGVTVYEALPKAGGMLRRCIPEYRLPRQVLDEEIQSIEGLGVEIKTNVKIGENLSFDDLWKEGYKAIFVASGAHKSHKIKIEGEDLEGVVHALDFLWHALSNEKIDVGKNVIAIGGGNVAIDAARTAIRLGAENVTVLYRRSREEMPANPWEVKEAEEEHVKIEFLVAPKRILGKDGKATRVECIRMQLGELDETGRRKPVPIEGSEFSCEANLVILAVGEAPDLEFLPKEIERNEDGTLWVNPLTMETTLKGVFAGGDAVNGPASVIEAICDGKHAAESIDKYVRSLER